MNFGTKGCMYCEGECNKECLTKEELKQETLEEVVNNFKKTDVYINEIKQEQDKKLYSEEDMKDYALKCISNYLFGEDFISDNLRIPIVENNNKQFEQFKNK